MKYNKDRDLVFVYRPNGLWGEQEYVYEMHHLERMVPAVSGAFKDMSFNRDDGLLKVSCMSTGDILRFYGEAKYWNMDLRPEFMEETGNLWKGYLTDKYEGTHFKHGDVTSEVAAMQRRVNKELAEAVKKHGEASRAEDYVNIFKQRIRVKQDQLSSA